MITTWDNDKWGRVSLKVSEKEKNRHGIRRLGDHLKCYEEIVTEGVYVTHIDLLFKIKIKWH